MGLVHLPVYLLLKDQGFPDIDIRRVDPSVASSVAAFAVALSNLPDLVSVATFLVMLCHFRGCGGAGLSSPSSVHPAQLPLPGPLGSPGVNSEEDRGKGGEDDFSVKSPSRQQEQLQEQQHQQQEEHHQHQQQQPQPQPHHHQQPSQGVDDHATSRVMRALRFHVLLSTVDVSLVVLSIFVCSPVVGKTVHYSFQLACCYWVPLLVVKSGFRQMDGMGRHLWNAVCRNGGED